ncbi:MULTISPECIES: DUF4145 domain-containing protein [unclassified Mesorhizobium]|uniref:DUF4145 domain-containing protein n=2 Tax=Mesorhizobium TaxID=68287 RepID=UPI000BB00C75|nr:DUF4145 domain-containing protein [Mesorhizobium sp. CA9]MBZ9770187.1 DUF4145 domain-containing protein [Mesorhizobium sp. CA6]MBZ9812334.1 DUF4145 domain-containing protein [Mesorhizobium sp. CA7]MBZ9828438.1 DUF4145 domain-containing protein [Mesorhizobium sp. CA18]MBZ9834175.1 DUF4145 domain-containing protein [Mesorhizobium sp. CA2]MBZ9840271.1 DUF4145 domain-containing protein [Mesorhizobium sp. CA3]MBZ9880416.1 DUF4145 domain-containing protein [Mesorhizobium sp. Ca11]MBZ9903850.1 D
MDYSYTPRDFLYVPHDVWRTYEDACKILPVSPAGSAVISRRCLEDLLLSLGHTQRSLAKQIRSATKTDRPGGMAGTYTAYADMIRCIGNLAAHPFMTSNGLRSFEVEYEDAHWCLEMIEELFDFFYEKPEAFETRTMELQGRLMRLHRP